MFFPQVQAVLLLLGGREIPPTMPTMPVSPHHNNRVLLHYLVGMQLMLFFLSNNWLMKYFIRDLLVLHKNSVSLRD